MVTATWSEFTAGMTPNDIALLEAFRSRALAFPDAHEVVHRTELQYVRARIFAASFITAHRLEIAIDLLREVEHPKLRSSFPTTKRVFTHRFSFEQLSDLDKSIDALLAESYETVGPGTPK
ncbi:DUF5655 domain-containing protein [Leifsonia sp. A12D58]|uniref:DUF5655 domain-containing protein n=1 Tax=Leifsonia sp. A12D58 TaxID=3397674 RepID=UPI0039DFF56D